MTEGGGSTGKATSFPAYEGPLFLPPRGAADAGTLTHGSGFNIGVEESNDYVDEDSQVEGNASPECHSAGEPVHQRHAWRERRQTHKSQTTFCQPGKALSSQTSKGLSSVQLAGPEAALVSHFL